MSHLDHRQDDHHTGMGSTDGEGGDGGHARLRWWFLVVVVASAVPRLVTAGRYITTDEPRWMGRSVRFSDALANLEFSQASASLGEPATMPGGPTMWIGTIARMIWGFGGTLGLTESPKFYDAEGLFIAQHVAVAVNALLIGCLFVAITRWVGMLPALVATVLIATEPWFVALGSVLHTDEITALLGTLGIVLTALALGIPDPTRRVSRPGLVAALAGVTLMGSALTKVTGMGYWTGAAVLAIWAVMRHRRDGGAWFDRHAPLRLCSHAALAGLAVVPIMWPALLADPSLQVERLMASAGLATEPAIPLGGLNARQYFLGELDNSPGWFYYLVALPLRLTPWMFVLVVTCVPLTFAWRQTRRHALVFLAPLSALFIVLSTSPKKFDRYGLLLLIPLAVIIGLGVEHLRRGRVGHRQAQRIVGGLGALALLYSLVVAPWGLAYFNPALGGSQRGVENLLVGWGEGREQAVDIIERLVDGDCSSVTVEGLEQLHLFGYPCTQPALGGRADFVVLYINAIQRTEAPSEGLSGRDLIDVVEIRGITYVEIWR
jgi:hypothetical protein